MNSPIAAATETTEPVVMTPEEKAAAAAAAELLSRVTPATMLLSRIADKRQICKNLVGALAYLLSSQGIVNLDLLGRTIDKIVRALPSGFLLCDTVNSALSRHNEQIAWMTACREVRRCLPYCDPQWRAELATIIATVRQTLTDKVAAAKAAAEESGAKTVSKQTLTIPEILSVLGIN